LARKIYSKSTLGRALMSVSVKNSKIYMYTSPTHITPPFSSLKLEKRVIDSISSVADKDSGPSSSKMPLRISIIKNRNHQ
jgi:hypothetical protein